MLVKIVIAGARSRRQAASARWGAPGVGQLRSMPRPPPARCLRQEMCLLPPRHAAGAATRPPFWMPLAASLFASLGAPEPALHTDAGMVIDDSRFRSRARHGVFQQGRQLLPTTTALTTAELTLQHFHSVAAGQETSVTADLAGSYAACTRRGDPSKTARASTPGPPRGTPASPPQLSFSFSSRFGMPLTTGKRRPVSGHTRAPSSKCTCRQPPAPTPGCVAAAREPTSLLAPATGDDLLDATAWQAAGGT
jgi:hypothetical protein